MNINLNEATFVKLLKANAERFSDRKAAIRAKSLGIWQTKSWKQYYGQVKHFSLGLSSLGLVHGDTVAVIGNNRPASLYSVIGIQAAGGVPLCLYQDTTSTELLQTINQYDVKFLIAEDQEQVDKLLEIRTNIPTLSMIICCDMRGMRNYRQEYITSFEKVVNLGNQADTQHPGLFEKDIESGKGDDIALICTTSGTTDQPRGAILSFRNLLSMAQSLNMVEPKKENDEFVSFLPIAWFGEQMISLASALMIGFTVNFPEKPETVMSDLREIGPHIIFCPPQVWEEIASSVQVRIMETTPFKRFMYNTFMPLGRRVADLRLSGKPISFLSSVLFGIAHIGLFRALRDRLGLSRVRSAITGGSALGPDVFTFFHSIGVNLKQVYGLTEISGISCIHRDNDIKGTTVGVPLPGTEIKISPEGEILLKSDGVFKGYYKAPQATEAALKEGWLHTGDSGCVDQNGHLVVTDRIQNVMHLTDGSAFAPRFAESKLKFSPYIKEAVIVGKGRPYLTALICIDGRVVGKWAGDCKISFTTYSDLTSKSEVYDLIEKEMLKANQDQTGASRIRKFTLLYKDLDADELELTRNGKVRRNVVEERYAEIIDAVYAGAESLPIDTTIDLQDGKSARIQTRVLIKNL